MEETAFINFASAHDLRSAMDVALPIFVLIDPMLGEPLPPVAGAEDETNARKAAWQRDITVVLLHPSISLPQHQHPYLVALQGLDDPLLDDTIEIAQEERLNSQRNGLDGTGGAPHRIAGWLQTSMHVEQLAAQLATMFRVNTVAFTTARYMRQVDRRTLSLLCHVVGDARVAAQFGRLQSWAYVDATGALAVLRSAGEEITPLRLSIAEWAVMESGALLHRAVAQCFGEKARTGDAMPDMETEAIFPTFLSALSDARQAARRWPGRFAGTPDLTAWTALSVRYPGLTDSSAVARFMSGPTGTDEAPDLLRYLHPELSAIASASAAIA